MAERWCGGLLGFNITMPSELPTGKYATQLNANTQIRGQSFAQKASESGFFGLGKEDAQKRRFLDKLRVKSDSKRPAGALAIGLRGAEMLAQNA